MSEPRPSQDHKIWLALIAIVLLFTAVIVVARHANVTRERQSGLPTMTRYTNHLYLVRLQYPFEWVQARGYDYERYEGRNGFFGISAGGSESVTLDEMAEIETKRPSEPYGSSPNIQALSLDGREARIIIPSSDQDPSMRGQAALIVRYPEPLSIDSEEYPFFILWADKNNIHYIASSISFVSTGNR